jgi:uncharacterized protein (TIGR02391 family)
MILTDKEMHQIRESIEEQAGLDGELAHRCGHLIHLGAFDEAVRSAFVLLEERLKEAVGHEEMTGSNLANRAFRADGSLTKLLAHTKSEQEGLRELYSGAFKLFRNPTAHGVVNYSAAEGKAIIALVNLLLIMLKRAGEMPPLDLLPKKVEILLTEIEQAVGAGAASRIRLFLCRCMEMGLKPAAATVWIPFKRYAFVKYKAWDEPKSYAIPLFYIGSDRLQIPLNYYYPTVIGLETDQLVEELTALGFQPSGKHREPTVSWKTHNSREFFDDLLELFQRTSDMFEETLQR